MTGLTTASNLDKFLDEHPLNLRLLHALWAPPNLLCLRAACFRLEQLSRLIPNQFQLLVDKGCPSTEEMHEWLKWIVITYDNSLKTELKVNLTISPVDALHRGANTSIRHPLSGYGMTDFPMYSSLLITPPPGSKGNNGFDLIAAHVALIGIEDHLSVSQNDYFNYANAFHLKKNKNESSLWKSTIENKPKKLKRLDNARRGVAELQQNESLGDQLEKIHFYDCTEEIIDVLNTIVDTLQSQTGTASAADQRIKDIVSLLQDNPIKPKSKSDTPPHRSAQEDSNGSDFEEVDAQHITHHVSSRDYTYLQLDSIHLIDPMQPQEFSESLTFEYEETDDEDIEDTDLPIEERRGLATTEVTSVEREQQFEPGTLEAWTKNKADFARRLAEYQPFSIDYINVDTRIALIQELQQRTTSKDYCLAANYLLASLISGRSIDTLKDGILPISELDQALDQHVMLMDQTNHLIWLKVNPPKLKKPSAACAVETGNWIVIEDTLLISSTLHCPLNLVEKNMLSLQLKGLEREVLLHLDVKPSQIAKLLPTTLLEIEGNFCTAALLTDWGNSHLKVNLHYLTPRASVVAQRYLQAMAVVLHQDFEHVLEQPTTYVCHRNTPHPDEVKRVVSALGNLQLPNNVRERHNHIALNTVMMLSLGIGLRATVNIEPGGIELLDKSIAHLAEKGATRLVALPKLVADQLIAYEQHMSLMRQLWKSPFFKNKTSSRLFFLLDADNNALPFQPSKLTDYLLDLGIDTSLEIRGLRRLIFTFLYNKGTFGRSADHFISHAVNGSEAFVECSGTRLQSLIEVSSFINTLLTKLNWSVAAGVNHHHVNFK